MSTKPLQSSSFPVHHYHQTSLPPSIPITPGTNHPLPSPCLHKFNRYKQQPFAIPSNPSMQSRIMPRLCLLINSASTILTCLTIDQ
ncbi:hypothetical protein K402DRAFT_399070 [Aulographum hederae CBS 113979]|uniref:Uncharacterized protein n=1 Tax=Aulographum hederae CBS 113979 TaxID=1176131 RepID=A0A6G1GJH7_9PEZI|nr:hypothetical protein K402DRAFT_399070 [Aulographum hederae CBS 113979]